VTTRDHHSGDVDEDAIRYRVVLNDEEQYSIWPVDRDCPAGWRDEGTIGTKGECLAHIDEVWTDITPLSVRRAMEGDRRS
jgi:MbtH protein